MWSSRSLHRNEQARAQRARTRSWTSEERRTTAILRHCVAPTIVLLVFRVRVAVITVGVESGLGNGGAQRRGGNLGKASVRKRE